jgi:hypothetical protein
LNSIWGLGIGYWVLGIRAKKCRRARAKDLKRHSSLVTRHSSLGMLSLVLLFTLSACGSGITQTAQTERYTIAITLDSASFGERTATIAVDDRSGQPAAVDQVVLAPVMEAMGMAAPELTAQSTAPGRYQVKGEFFSMIGEWQVNVRVSSAGKDDMARFIFQVQQ